MKIDWRFRLLVLIGFLVYLPSFGNPFIWDDEQFIVKNAYVQDFKVGRIFTSNTTEGAGVVSNYYRPLTTLSFAIDKLIWGMNPIGFHLTNTWMHSLAGGVLYLLLVELVKDGDKKQVAGAKEETKSGEQKAKMRTKAGFNSLLAVWHEGWRKRWGMPFWVALFFVIHPIQTEAVTYINSRGDSFYALLLFAGLLAFVKSLGLSFQARVQKGLLARERVLLVFAVGLYLLSILAKEIAVAGIGLYGLVWVTKILQGSVNTKGGVRVLVRRFWVQMWAMVAMLGVLGSYLGARLTFLNFDNSLNFYGEASNPYAASLWVRMLTLGKIFWTYPRLLLCPYPLHMERTSEVFLEINVWFVAMVAVLVLIPLCGWWEWRKLKSVWVWLGYGWYVVMMMPVSGIVAINGLVYEHWLYVPMVGFWLMGYGVLRLMCGQRGGGFLVKLLGPFVLVGVSFIFVGLTLRQNWIWGDRIRFYEYTLGYGKSTRLYNNLGMAMRR